MKFKVFICPFLSVVLIVLIAQIFLPASVSANDKTVLDTAGPYRISVEITPKTPKVGKNTVLITVIDGNGQPVPNTKIKAVAIMPAMGSMPAMYAPADLIEISTGHYEGIYQPSMAGEWPMTIEINAALGSAKITYDLATGRKGIRCVMCDGDGKDVPGTVRVDTARRQLIGITTGKVREKKLRIAIRAAGRISYDETRLSDVSLKFSGWIGKIYANALGKPVTKGKTLFTVYSPELLAAQEEYLEIRKRVNVNVNKKSNTSQKLLNAAKRRLRLWSLTNQQIRSLEDRGYAQDYIPILSPVNGIIIHKSIVKGSAFQAGQQLFRIADIKKLWVEAEVYESDLELILPGMKAKVIFQGGQNQSIKTVVDYIYPYMENQSRTGKIRLVLDNSQGLFRPDGFVQVLLKVKLSKRLVVPESTVIYAGKTRLVFLDLGDGRLQPKKIVTGRRNRKWIEVVDGLKKGDQVITSGNFLIASESKLKSGIQQW